MVRPESGADICPGIARRLYRWLRERYDRGEMPELPDQPDLQEARRVRLWMEWYICLGEKRRRATRQRLAELIAVSRSKGPYAVMRVKISDGILPPSELPYLLAPNFPVGQFQARVEGVCFYAWETGGLRSALEAMSVAVDAVDRYEARRGEPLTPWGRDREKP